jgi:4-hydroxy-4-methyl-2-oxoglutarate aldolase
VLTCSTIAAKIGEVGEQKAGRATESAADLKVPSMRMTTAHLCDVSPTGILMDRGIRPIWPGAHAAGPAFTVKTPPGDNASLVLALQQARPGDMLVVDSGGGLDRALWGAILSLAASQRGIVGLVIDGAVRDRDEIAEMGYPVFARGISPDTPYNKVHGSTGRPITCGGLSVNPGDAVYADGDGVVVIPRAAHDATRDRATHRIELEARVFSGLSEGRTLEELLPILGQTRRI